MGVVHALIIQQSVHGIQRESFLDINFIALLLGTVFIAAAGNIINDYFDVKIDRINKPEKLIVDRHIKKRTAILFHSVLNGLGVLCGTTIFLTSWDYFPVIMLLFMTAVLWWYSMVLKRKFLSGNIAISFLIALLPVMVYLFDIRRYTFTSPESHELAFHFMSYFTLFAFCTTLIREIQKDFADMKGDSMYGCKTVPLYLGIKKGRIILFTIMVVTLILFIVLFFLKAKYNLVNISFFAAITLLMSVSFLQSFYAVKRKAWSAAATTMKLVMITALLFFVFKIYA